ncbi:TPA: hypothetical protein HH295_15300 [Xanthomonas vasicola pv. zeae]|uniref:Uncharacterized protein n=3 Tax=Xanthomonas vasicola TaxID=56459 RepID=A0A837APR8_XANVA|nr:hypothetical protein C7V42_03075 [Xanthomonas vasicola pv. vasculorum]AZR29667.1 hypothetical protein KWO_002980 [Xanthomonas vasicola pv. musacearum NCPPB 4379]AZR33596.1 hypothetical protein NX08_002880 [Xanthomonas vasicola]KEZ97739.1 hypothetical protein A11M_0109220 [Xanthomonas vasicola pv. vasculorum NCPPB 895]KFA06008.1 hypothetical protein KWQ_0118920 [Xanthomonas vasicola pv. musacearum NCPPB 4380]KFA06295.1 hypothetical protein KWM_0117095 [Xanthomonas vasicola pv. musacearum NCP
MLSLLGKVWVILRVNAFVFPARTSVKRSAPLQTCFYNQCRRSNKNTRATVMAWSLIGMAR